TLVVAEVALALVLLVGAGLTIKSFLRLIEVRPGFDPHNVLTMQMTLPPARYAKDEQVVSFYQQLVERVAAQPGVEAVGVINYLPMAGSGGTTSFVIAGRPAPKPGQYPEANARIVSPDYFRTMRIPVLRGRGFTAQDRSERPRVALINETMARTYFPDEDALGKVLLDPDGKNPTEIVGIVGDIKHFGLDDAPEPYLYVPHTQVAENSMSLVVRTASEPAAMTAVVRREVAALDKDQPLYNIKNMEQRISETATSA